MSRELNNIEERNEKVRLDVFRSMCMSSNSEISMFSQTDFSQRHPHNKQSYYIIRDDFEYISTYVPINSKTSSGSIPNANFSGSSIPNTSNCSSFDIVANSSAVIVAICSCEDDGLII